MLTIIIVIFQCDKLLSGESECGGSVGDAAMYANGRGEGNHPPVAIRRNNVQAHTLFTR